MKLSASLRGPAPSGFPLSRGGDFPYMAPADEQPGHISVRGFWQVPVFRPRDSVLQKPPAFMNPYTYSTWVF